MKHLFLAHSHITFLVSSAIIESLGLSKEDVVFVTTRKYKVSNFQSIDFDKEFEELNNTGYSNFYKKWKVVKKVDNKVFQGREFQYNLYIPHLANILFQILATNKECIRVNIIEEGVNCLSDRIYNPIPSVKRKMIDLVFNRSGLYGKRRFFRPASNIDFKYCLKAEPPIFYGLSRLSFKYVSSFEKKILKLVNISNNSIPKVPDGSIILLLESIVEQNGLSAAVFFDSIESIRNEIQSDVIYLKYHPYQNQENRARIENILERKFKVVILDDSVIVEYLLLTSKNLNVFGFTTSLLFYAKLFNHKVKSFSALWNNDKKFQQYRSFNDFDLNKIIQETQI